MTGAALNQPAVSAHVADAQTELDGDDRRCAVNGCAAEAWQLRTAVHGAR